MAASRSSGGDDPAGRCAGRADHHRAHRWTHQVAYNDIPLYYYAGDEQPGDINGQGVGGVWFIVPPGATHGPYPAAPGEGTPVPASSVQIGFTEELGPFLTDAEGMTVYLFTKDVTAGESACYDDCATAWPPVPAADGMMLPPGIAGTLSAIERTDGSQQMTYNDIPLYYFARGQPHRAIRLVRMWATSGTS